jgi:phosphoglycolate phosphatase-like HAD superfamily hydrolase
MIVLIEVDGVVLDVRSAYRHAYEHAVGCLGLARIDEATFWRLVRTGAAEGQILRGSKPRHWKQYRSLFDSALGSAESLARLRPREGVAEILRRLCGKHDVLLIVEADQADARRGTLTDAGLLQRNCQIAAVGGGLDVRSQKITGLCRDGGRALVAGAGQRFLRAAGEAGLFCVGVASGPCTGKRLEQAGAERVYSDLEDLADAILRGADELGRVV